jgi:cytochrome c peroxidase
VKEARSAAEGVGCVADARYVALRRAVARAAPWIRVGARMSAEVLLGPARPSDEGAGAIAGLDQALAARDCAAAGVRLGEVRKALDLAPRELEDAAHVLSARAAQVVSDAAYDLGLAIFQALPSSSAFDEVDLGIAHGLADAVRDGLSAVDATRAPEAARRAKEEIDALQTSLAAASGMSDLHGRGTLVLRTGALGLAFRELARAAGHPARAPYPARGTEGDAAVSALSLPRSRLKPDASRVALGRRLFSDRRLSRGARRACITCHEPGRAFTDGLARPISFERDAPLRNTPTLAYVDLSSAQLWDGRLVTTDAQALHVIHAPGEMGLTPPEIVAAVSGDAEYRTGFTTAFPDGITERNVALAVGAFVTSLGEGTAPVDAFARGDAGALGADGLAGLDVLAGKGRCARCHVPPYFGGSRPTDFAVPVYGVLGVPTAPKKRVLDPDPGRGALGRQDGMEHAFKTPTLRNAKLTAPYFHNGAFRTLEETIDFYDQGGGRGLGLEVPNQDPDVRPLLLSPEEKRVLAVFLREALLDPPTSPR